MKTKATLNRYLLNAPAAPCLHYGAGDVVVCAAKGKSKNSFIVRCATPVVAFETDGQGNFRFPPQGNVCDWCVFTETGLRGWFIELKGSDFDHAVNQLKSTMTHMRGKYSVAPKVAVVVLSGRHPSNARPGKANAKARFKSMFPDVPLLERSCGQTNSRDCVR